MIWVFHNPYIIPERGMTNSYQMALKQGGFNPAVPNNLPRRFNTSSIMLRKLASIMEAERGRATFG
jgi:hypothetical protein